MKQQSSLQLELTEHGARYRQWCDYAELEPALRLELEAIADDEAAIRDRFYRDLSFGTGGMRGVMGAGSNRMNVYTVERASAGLALYLLSEYGREAMERGVVIAYDSRRDSQRFARETALTLNAFGIRAYVFDRLTPTPELSFAVRYRQAAAGVVITASHNTKEYNGYKVYDAHGCQVVPEIAARIQEKIDLYQELEQLPLLPDYEEACSQDLYHEIGDEYHGAFVQAVLRQALLRNDGADAAAKAALRVVYTPLHGTGLLPVTSVLEKDGFCGLSVLESQRQPDGNFRTVRSPNPEEEDALRLAIEYGAELGADIVLGTDPDCDRVGVAVWDGARYRLLTGNQTGALLVDYVLTHRAVTPASVVLKTIVTSELGADVARAHGVQVMDVLTGFKYIGEKMTEFEAQGDHEFVMGYEESYGYLVGTHARDKDAVVASMLVCEMAACQKARGKTLLDRLEELYRQHGYYKEALDSFTLPGADGQARIARIMAALRAQAPREIGGLAVAERKDYAAGLDGLPQADVLKYLFEEGGWMAVRPSGTEPKIKFYYSLRGASMEAAERAVQALREAVRAYMQSDLV